MSLLFIRREVDFHASWACTSIALPCGKEFDELVKVFASQRLYFSFSFSSLLSRIPSRGNDGIRSPANTTLSRKQNLSKKERKPPTLAFRYGWWVKFASITFIIDLFVYSEFFFCIFWFLIGYFGVPVWSWYLIVCLLKKFCIFLVFDWIGYFDVPVWSSW